MISWGLQLVGLLVGFVAAIFMAISQGPGGITHGTERGEAPYIILARPRLWRWGLYLLSVAFVFQLASLILHRCGL